MVFRRFVAPLAALMLVAPAAGRAQDAVPAGWRWVTDVPALPATGQASAGLPDSLFRFERMPPGYHVTTGPGVLLYHPGYRADSLYAVEAEIFLFPGESQEEYGVFLGGAELDGEARGYTAFVVRRDGSFAVQRRAGTRTQTVVPWTRHDSVVAHPGGNDVIKNVLRVTVDPGAVTFAANGAELAVLSPGQVGASGHFGFRVGPDVNLHASRLDLTLRLAPPRPPS